MRAWMEGTEADPQEAPAIYEQPLLEAFEDVESALVRYLRESGLGFSSPRRPTGVEAFGPMGALGLGDSYMDGWWDCDRTLMACAGAFRARKMHWWQWVLSSGERREGYARVAG